MTPENPNEFSYAEKLALVANEAMAPEEIGCASVEEAVEKGLIVLPNAKPEPFLGQFCTFEVSEVPIDLRREWAKQECKIIGGFDAEKWDDENKNTHRLQARLRCGNMSSLLERTVTDQVTGFALMLEDAANMLLALQKRLAAGTMKLSAGDPLKLRDKAIDVEATVMPQS